VELKKEQGQPEQQQQQQQQQQGHVQRAMLMPVRVSQRWKENSSKGLAQVLLLLGWRTGTMPQVLMGYFLAF
jgi:hypothetical protein